jgi:hypothetical protein
MRIITLEVISVGFAAINKPNKEPNIDIKPIPKNNKKNKESELKVIENIKIKIIVIIDVIISEYRVEANIIPNKISFNDIGETKILSNDFSRVSIGKTTGLIAVAVKKDVIATIPINTKFKEISLPIIHERVIKKGNIKPKINTGPFLIYSVTFFLHKIQILFKLSWIIYYPSPL